MIYNGADYVYLFFLADLATGKDGVTGQTPTVYGSKAGVAFASLGVGTEVSNGWYKITIPTIGFLASFTGDLAIKSEVAGVTREWRDKLMVVPWNPMDAEDLGVSDIEAAGNIAVGGVELSTTAVDDIWDEGLEIDETGAGEFSARQMMRGVFAHATGLAVRTNQGGVPPTNLIEYMAPDGSVSRIAHQVTSEGARLAVTYNFT